MNSRTFSGVPAPWMPRLSSGSAITDVYLSVGCELDEVVSVLFVLECECGPGLLPDVDVVLEVVAFPCLGFLS